MSAGNLSELVLVALAAMVSPTTLTFCVLALVLGDRPLRTGCWFFLGAFAATAAVGVAAALVIGDIASSPKSAPKTWVAVLDVVLAVAIFAFAGSRLRRPVDPETTASMIERMNRVTSSPAVAIVGAGAVLANPGAFIPIALKAISESHPTRSEYATEWLAFTAVSLLPLIAALVLLVVAPDATQRVLGAARHWLERHAVTVGYVIALLLGIALLRNGIAGLTSQAT
ncbi:MAG: GAP family protein [Verrucomicrobiota bacterium]